jgi:hypothetical protein
MELNQLSKKTDERKSVKFFLKRFMMLMAVIVAAMMTFSACIEDDNEGDENGNNGNGNGGGGVTGKRIKTMVHSSGEGPVRFEYSYNSDGTTKQVDAYDAASKLVMRDVITCNPDGTWKILEQTDLAYSGTVLVLNHTYDANKKPQSINGTTYLDGTPIGTTTFSFTFQNGRKVSQKQTVTAMGVLAQEVNSEFQYDANGRRTKTISTPRVGVKVEYTRTAYNPDGTLKTITVSGGQSFTITFTWEDGKSTVNMDDIWGW